MAVKPIKINDFNGINCRAGAVDTPDTHFYLPASEIGRNVTPDGSPDWPDGLFGERMMGRNDRRSEFDDFDARIDRLRQDSGTVVDDVEDSGKKAPNTAQVGMHIGIELVAGVIGGALLGYALDAWLDMKPLWLIVFLVLGSAAGLLNAYRYISRMDRDGSDATKS